MPAKHLDWRFEENIRNNLLKLKWWEIPYEILRKSDLMKQEEITLEILNKLRDLKDTYCYKLRS